MVAKRDSAVKMDMGNKKIGTNIKDFDQRCFLERFEESVSQAWTE